MKIVFAGWVAVESLLDDVKFDREPPVVKCRFPLGTDMAVGLAKRGHHVSIVVPDGMCVASEVWRGICISGKRGSCDLWRVPGSKRTWEVCLSWYWKEVSGIRACIQRIAPDVVFAQWTYAFAAAGITSGFPTLVVAHDSPWRIAWTLRSLPFLFRALFAQFFVLPRALHLSTVSPYIVDELRRYNGYRRAVTVIPNGISMDDVRVRLIRENATTVVCVGEWSRRKNPQPLMAAFAGFLCRRNKRLIMFGRGMSWEGPAGAWARRRWGVQTINELLQRGVELRGSRPRAEVMRSLEEEADVFCSPSLEESFGMVFIEAMARGVPCVGGEKSGAVPWVLGDAGCLCNVRSSKEIATTLLALLLNYKLRLELSDKARARVRLKFSLAAMIDAYETELKKLGSASSGLIPGG